MNRLSTLIRSAVSELQRPTVGQAIVLAAVGLGGFGIARLSGGAGDRDSTHVAGSSPQTADADPRRIEFPSDRWSAAGIRIEPAVVSPFRDSVWRTGRIGFNEDRLATISSPIEGIIREVHGRIGADVKTGDVLAVLDSREFGQAKLELAKSRLALLSAKAQAEWTRTITANADDMLKDLASAVPLAEIERRFQNRPIGDWRQQLLTAYSKRNQLKSLVDDMTAVGTATIAAWNLRQTRSEFETHEAAFRAICEELKFQTKNQARSAEQKLLEAISAEEIAKAHLLMMGLGRDEVAKLDPLAEGDRISLYPVRAPFAGTIIDKHAVLAGRVGPNTPLFQIADISTVWIQADLFDADLPLLRNRKGHQVTFRSPTAKIDERPAEVFHSGDVIDGKSRSLTMSAVAANADRSLKPGLFVEVGLPRADGETILQVPTSAIQRHENAVFVFIHEGGDVFRRVDVVLGRAAGERTEIRSGLTSGTNVVVDGTFSLKSELLRDLLGGD